MRQCFDERGLLIERTETGGDGTHRRRHFTYDLAGRTVKASIDPLGNTDVEYEYDAFGRPFRTRTPNGSTVTFEYGPDDLLIEELVEGDPGDGTFRLLRRTRDTYDQRGRLLTTSVASFDDDPSVAIELVTTNAYDADGNVVSITGPHGAVTSYGYDALGRLIETVDDLGNRVEQEWSGFDRSVRTTRHDVTPSGVTVRTWQFVHDEQGRVIQRSDPYGNVERTEYDERDLPVVRIAADGRRVTFRFGPNGERREMIVDADGLAEAHQWTYDAMGRLVRYEDPAGVVTTITLDGLGREIERLHPDAALTRLFGANGHLTEEWHPSGARLVFTHDSSGRVRSVEGVGAPGVAAVPRVDLDYDGLDRVIRAAHPGAVLDRRYDSLGRLVAESQDGVTIDVVHDDVTRTSTRVWPDGRSERTELDAAGRPVSIDLISTGALGAGPPSIAAFTPADGDLVAGMVRLGALTTTASYDLARRLTELSVVTAAGDVDRRRYRYDATGRRCAEDALAPGSGRTWQRDALRRAIEVREGIAQSFGSAVPATQAEHDADTAAMLAASATATTQLTYGPGDDRNSIDVGAGPVASVQGPGHRLAQVGPDAVSHHADGPRALDARWRYDVDALGRVVAVRPASGGQVVASISYDPLGRPLEITESGQTRPAPVRRRHAPPGGRRRIGVSADHAEPVGKCAARAPCPGRNLPQPP